MSVAIVIPYFQREAGILARCLRSIQSQRGEIDYHVFIVDDDSPVPTASELSAFAPSFLRKVTVLERENGGPAEARNTALDAIDPTLFSQIAFLDSDDEWEDFHLANALNLLTNGAEFYFANFYQLGDQETVFEKAARNQKFDISCHIKTGGNGSYFYDSNFIEQIIFGNIVGTSTAVFNTSCLSDIRFAADYYFAGEDYIFWLDVASRTDKIAFSRKASCRYGKGVNIYSASGWGSEYALERIHDELRYLKSTLRRFKVTPKTAALRKEKIRALQGGFVRELLHRLVTRKRIRLKTLCRTFLLDPLIVFYGLVRIVKKNRS